MVAGSVTLNGKVDLSVRQIRQGVFHQLVAMIQNKIQRHLNGPEKEYQSKVKVVASMVEETLFKTSSSITEYVDQGTLEARLFAETNELHKKRSLRRQSQQKTIALLTRNNDDNDPAPDSPLRCDTSADSSRCPTPSATTAATATAADGSNSECHSFLREMLTQVRPNVSPRSAVMQQQQLLLMLRHAFKCPCGVSSCPVLGEYCWKLKLLIAHVMRCQQAHCPHPQCCSARRLLEHYQKCKSLRCPLQPVRLALQRQFPAPTSFDATIDHSQCSNNNSDSSNICSITSVRQRSADTSSSRPSREELIAHLRNDEETTEDCCCSAPIDAELSTGSFLDTLAEVASRQMAIASDAIEQRTVVAAAAVAAGEVKVALREVDPSTPTGVWQSYEELSSDWRKAAAVEVTLSPTLSPFTSAAAVSNSATTTAATTATTTAALVAARAATATNTTKTTTATAVASDYHQRTLSMKRKHDAVTKETTITPDMLPYKRLLSLPGYMDEL